MKKAFCIILIILTLTVYFSAEAFADNITIGGDCGQDVTWSLTADGILTISGVGDMADYEWFLPAPWSDHSEQITSVIISDGVSYIGKRAFDNCSEISSVYIPASVISIGKYAFADCTSLAEVDLPESLEIIDEYAFWGCSGLIEMILPESLEALGEAAFSACDSLERIIFLSLDTDISSYSSVIPDETVIHGYENSSAEEYSKTFEKTFLQFCGGDHIFSEWQKYSENEHIRYCEGVMSGVASFGTASGYLSVADKEISWPTVAVGAEYTVIYADDTSSAFSVYETHLSVPEGIEKVEVFFDGISLGCVTFIDTGGLGCECYGCETSEHEWDEGKVSVDPTCCTDGEITYVCIGCGEEKTAVVSANGEHTYSSWSMLSESEHIGFCGGIAQSTTVAGSPCSQVIFSIPIYEDLSEDDSLVLRLPTRGTYSVLVGEEEYPLGTCDKSIYGEYVIKFGDYSFGYNPKDGDTILSLSEIVEPTVYVIGRFPITANASGKVTYKVTASDFGYYTQPSENGYANSKFTTTFWPTTQRYDVYAVWNNDESTLSYCWDWSAENGDDITDSIRIMSNCRAYQTNEHRWDVENAVIEDDVITYTCIDCCAEYSKEYIEYQRGDLNGDGEVNKNDAIYLLYSVLFGSEAYPQNQSCDFDADGQTNKNDAIYLLYHVLFDGAYPIE